MNNISPEVMNEYGHNEKVQGGCGLFGIINVKRKPIPGSDIINAIAVMHDRGNGLGGGFAAYGIYPEYAKYYAFHIMYENNDAVAPTEHFLAANFNITYHERIPTQVTSTIQAPPVFFRYFLEPKEEAKMYLPNKDDNDFVVCKVMHINENIKDAYVISSGKNMGAFKGVGYPEEIAEFFKLDDYKAYIWTAHNRFPTNTKGWWGGAHPFTLLDWAIVHNGEISSYGINKRFLEMYGYKLTLLTDTEVITYIFDLLVRRYGFDFRTAASVVASPFWKDIDAMPESKKEVYTALRMTLGSALLNGPFAIILSHSNGFMGLSDRIKLRPLVSAQKGEVHYLSSEESAIRRICPKLDNVRFPKAGEPVIINLE